MPPRPGLHHHRLDARRHSGRDAVLRAAGRDARGVAAAADQPARRRRPSCRSSPQSSSACGTRRTTPPTSSATSPPARSRSTTASSTTRPNTASGATTSPTSRAPSRWPASTPQREAFLGPYRGWDRPIAVERGRARPTRSPTAGSRSAPITSSCPLAPGETSEIIFVLGYAENPRDEKFDPPGSQTLNKRTVRPVIDALSAARRRSSAAFGRLRESLGRPARRAPGDTPDEHTNRMVNIWNAYQCMVTFNMSRSASFFESGDRARHGLPRLQPGPARLRAHGPRAGARAHPRHRRHAAADRRRVSPVPAADQARQRRRRRRLQRRPALAGPGRRRLPQGDRRSGHPGRAGAVRQRRRAASAAVRAPAALAPVHARSPRPARPAADRPRRLERLPEPQLLLG